MILGAAGLLKGYNATCHWSARDQLSHFGAIPTQARVVIDGNRVTGGGVTAGIDFGFALMAEIAGEDHARYVQLGLEYDPAPPFRSGTPELASKDHLDRYSEMMTRFMPTRDARIEAAAKRLGFGS